jgi:predicted GNAT family acetyltransferase
MKIVRCSSPDEFLEETAPYRAGEPARSNVLGSVAESVVRDPHRYDAYWWWLVVDGDEVVGAAFRTAPFSLHLGPMPLEGATMLAHHVSEDDFQVPSVVGPDHVVAEFLKHFQSLTAREAVRGRRSLLYDLGELVVPDVEGTSRLASVADVELVAQWVDDFHFFIDGARPESNERDRTIILERIAAESIRLWCVRNVVVAMAGHAAPVATPESIVARVGPVFTPAENRRRGYGAAVSAALSDDLLRKGWRAILYADADNPTSNSIYQAIGYRFVDEIIQYDFADTK